MPPVDHGWDMVLAIAISAVGALMAICGWLIRQKFIGYDKWVDTTRAIGESLARAEERLAMHKEEDGRMFAKLQEDSAQARRALHWVGDCMIRMGAKLNLDLPTRPD